ncbi:MAG: MFS transporter [Clostridiales Family XIII bacterium]|jgi:GPH family glycoside/pentoside/hexuronide:cation symporter|nr:MFS transporter [Clostridiales Family XIII bacterium]
MKTIDAGQKRRALPIRMKAGYAIGQMSDSIGFNVFYFFFLFFLTDFAGVPAGTAGTISLIAVTWDAVTDPVVGHISDNLRSRHGRRRPMMLAALAPYSVCTYLLFNNIGAPGGAKAFYFGAVAILFWSCYKVYVIPFFALGAELTDDFDERTSLRVWASVPLYGAVMLTSAAPPVIIEFTLQGGGDGTDAWHNVGLIFGGAIALTVFVCHRATKGGEIVKKEAYSVGKDAGDAGDTGDAGHFVLRLFTNLRSVLRVKPAKFLLLSVLFWSVVSSMASGGLVYLMTNVLHYSASLQSICFVVLSLAGIVWLPAINFGSARFDKRRVYFLTLLFSAACLISFNFIRFPTPAFLIVFLVLFEMGNSAFWTLYYSMMYDISELDEFISGKRREGTIAALMSFSQKLGSAFALWLMGFVLDLGGYNGSAALQPDTALNAIVWVNTWIPGAIGLGAALFAFLYPLTKPRFNALLQALALKRNGEAHSTAGFEKLL